MTLHRLPAAPSSDSHRLVVIAGASAGGERVAQPKGVLGGHRVGDVGKGRRSLVRGDDQVGVIGVSASDAVGRDHVRAAQVVRDVQHAAQQRLVSFDALALEHRPIGRRILHHESAFGSHRHDDHVLHVLRFHQAENLRAEVFATIRPSDSSTGDLPGAKVESFHQRGVDEDLEERARGG